MSDGADDSHEKTGKWGRFFSSIATFAGRGGTYLSANALSTMMGLTLGIWTYAWFWHSTGVPSHRIIEWVIALYLIFEPITATLTIVDKERWKAAIVDIVVSVALVVQMSLVLFGGGDYALTPERREFAWLLFMVNVGAGIGQVVIMLIVNTRIFGSVPVSPTD